MSLIIFHKSTVDEEEIEKLSRTISDWWNPNGDFSALHSMNKLRVPFIKSSLEHLLGENVIPSKPLKGFRILDVGCGGGILSEVRVLWPVYKLAVLLIFIIPLLRRFSILALYWVKRSHSLLLLWNLWLRYVYPVHWSRLCVQKKLCINLTSLK